MIMSKQESSNGENCQQQLNNGKIHKLSSNQEYHFSHESSCSRADETENSTILADCLLTAVKVLMNLTNDNLIGCQQIAAYGGLETVSLLIASHFPLFSSSLSPSRSRLAAARISLSNSEGFKEESHMDVILLICFIFLANQGAGEGTVEPLDDEAALLEGEKEAEMMIVEAYAALLLAFLSTESMSTHAAIAECLPKHNLGNLVTALERFVAFHLTLNMISPETHKAVSEVIESCREP